MAKFVLTIIDTCTQEKVQSQRGPSGLSNKSGSPRGERAKEGDNRVAYEPAKRLITDNAQTNNIDRCLFRCCVCIDKEDCLGTTLFDGQSPIRRGPSTEERLANQREGKAGGSPAGIGRLSPRGGARERALTEAFLLSLTRGAVCSARCAVCRRINLFSFSTPFPCQDSFVV